MPRDPQQIQLEIDAARESLAGTLDVLAYRGSPQRIVEQGKSTAMQFLQSPVGMAAAGALGLLISIVVVRKIRHRKR